MNLFQWVTVSLLGLLCVRDLGRVWLGAGRFALARAIVWGVAAAAVAEPGLVQALADVLGIGRGADVVLYVFVLLFLGTSFYFYARQRQLQRQVTELVRHLAIQEARRGGEGEGTAERIR